MTTLFGIGVGPGDPELLTLKAARLIAELPVLAHIGADGRPSRARRIAAAIIAPGVTELAADMPMRCAPAAARPVYDGIAGRIRMEIARGRDVGFLCEGDPLLYGSFVAILDRLGGDVPISVVPGITSIAAGAARIGHVLTLRDEILTVLPATASDERLTNALVAANSIAIVKVGRHLPRIRHLLATAGLAECATVLTDIGGPNETVEDLGDIEGDRLPYFALILTRRMRVRR